jgi:threonine dehydrogenase-like Zn-dependent dehydrogenase
MSDSITTSLAAVFRVVGEPLTLERFPIPALAGSEALVRIRCATICGSDLHSYFGRRHSSMPSVLGHEMGSYALARLGELQARAPCTVPSKWASVSR